MAKTLCLDFDGVLHSYESGWKGAENIPDAPVPGAMEFIIDALEDGRFDLAIYSSRSGQPGGIEAMQAWSVAYLGGYMSGAGRLVREEIQWPTSKPAAFLTIDDRAVCFTGRFPPLDWIDDFRPWNKLEPHKWPTGADGRVFTPHTGSPQFDARRFPDLPWGESWMCEIDSANEHGVWWKRARLPDAMKP